MAYLEPKVPSFFSDYLPKARNQKNTTKELHTRTTFQWFIDKAPRYSFKKLITSMPLLLRGLHTISLVKLVPEGLHLQECKRAKLSEPLPVPYVPVKNKVQEEVAKMRNIQIKTLLEKNMTLNFLVWRKNGTQEVFLIIVTGVLDAIKKCGMFKDYGKAQKAYVEAKKAVELAETGIALLDKTGTGGKKNCKKKA
jgi:hypothetical protein